MKSRNWWIRFSNDRNPFKISQPIGNWPRKLKLTLIMKSYCQWYFKPCQVNKFHFWWNSFKVYSDLYLSVQPASPGGYVWQHWSFYYSKSSFLTGTLYAQHCGIYPPPLVYYICSAKYSLTMTTCFWRLCALNWLIFTIYISFLSSFNLVPCETQWYCESMLPVTHYSNSNIQ